MLYGSFQSQRIEPELAGTAWSWWTRPRAVSHGGIAYVGSTDRNGAVVVDEWPDAATVRTRHHISDLEGEQDDHNNPAIVVEPGKVPIVFYARHLMDGVMRYRKGTTPYVAGADLGPFEAERTVDFNAAIPGNVTYAIAVVHGDDLYLWCRCGGTLRWGFAKSTDWGETWETPQAVFSCNSQFYMGAILAGDAIRFTLSTHPINGTNPDQDIYYAEADLTTGAVTAGGVTLGNLDGTDLPILWSSCEQVATPPAGERTWAYDVSDGPNPEVAWAAFDDADPATTSTYYYSVKSGGTWTTNEIVAAGKLFPFFNERYLGGAQFPTDTPGGVVYTAREAGGTWHVDKNETADSGATWTVTEQETETARNKAAVRAWPVEQRDVTAPPFTVAANWADDFVHYDNWFGNVGGSRDPATA